MKFMLFIGRFSISSLLLHSPLFFSFYSFLLPLTSSAPNFNNFLSPLPLLFSWCICQMLFFLSPTSSSNATISSSPGLCPHALVPWCPAMLTKGSVWICRVAIRLTTNYLYNFVAVESQNVRGFISIAPVCRLALQKLLIPIPEEQNFFCIL